MERILAGYTNKEEKQTEKMQQIRSKECWFVVYGDEEKRGLANKL
ncbi:MAG: hypothetical protein ACLTCI_09625 [[Clostridium] nexile]